MANSAANLHLWSDFQPPFRSHTNGPRLTQSHSFGSLTTPARTMFSLRANPASCANLRTILRGLTREFPFPHFPADAVHAGEEE